MIFYITSKTLKKITSRNVRHTFILGQREYVCPKKNYNSRCVLKNKIIGASIVEISKI